MNKKSLEIIGFSVILLLLSFIIWFVFSKKKDSSPDGNPINDVCEKGVNYRTSSFPSGIGCQACSSCNEQTETVIDACTVISDTACGCKNGMYESSSSGTIVCKPCSMCNEQTETVKDVCTSTSDTECSHKIPSEDCKDNATFRFKNTPGANKCIDCKTCDDKTETVKTACTVTSDTICKQKEIKCATGSSYRIKSASKNQPCEPCKTCGDDGVKTPCTIISDTVCAQPPASIPVCDDDSFLSHDNTCSALSWVLQLVWDDKKGFGLKNTSTTKYVLQDVIIENTNGFYYTGTTKSSSNKMRFNSHGKAHTLDEIGSIIKTNHPMGDLNYNYINSNKDFYGLAGGRIKIPGGGIKYIIPTDMFNQGDTGKNCIVYPYTNNSVPMGTEFIIYDDKVPGTVDDNTLTVDENADAGRSVFPILFS